VHKAKGIEEAFAESFTHTIQRGEIQFKEKE